MDGLLRKLMIWICVPFYKLIPTIYDVFYDLANHRFFQPDPETGISVIEQLSSNLYVLISVVMLFVFSANILAAIVNPDLMNDKKKGIGALFKRAIIGLALIVIIPFAFDEAYKIQKDVMDRSLIEKMLVGISYDDENNKGGNGGQVIAGTLIASVLHPIDNNGQPVEISENVSEDYELMVTENIDYITKVAKHINVAPENSSEEYAFEFQQLVALIAGGVCCYLLLIFAFDMAVRTVKLAFLELTAPISIIAYMAAGEATLKSWAKTVLTTFLDVFMRIACMAFYIFMISQLDGFLEGINGNWFVKILLIVGMLIFVKELPEFINKALGFTIKTKGGIGGRLGSMAAVGDVAKKGWDTVSKGLKTVGLTAAGLGAVVGSGPLGWAATGAAVGGSQLWKNKLKDTEFGKGLTTAVTTAGAFLKSGNPISGINAATKNYRESNFAKERAAEKERQKMANLASIANLNEVGKVKDNELSTVKEETNNLLSKINSDIGLTNRQKEAIKGKITAEQINSLAQKAKDSNEKITSQFDTMIANSINNPKLNNELKSLKDGYMNGNMKLGDVAARLKLMSESGEIGIAEANNIIANANKLNSISSTISDIASDKNSILGKFMKENGLSTFIDQDGKLKSVKISILAGATDKYSTDAKSRYESLTSTASEDSKSKMERYDKTATMVTAEYARKASEANKPYDSAEKKSTNSQPQTQSNSASQTQTQQNINVSDSDDDIWEQTSDAQVQANEDRLNNVWNNQTVDNTYERGTYEPEKTSRDNVNDDNYDDIYSQYYDDNENE